ncbi:FkbM family methyltransferase [Pinibacter aurantiacus]|uniref:FkbM family methyltransferase n=1 Tax=Pinibacter aurantiacus TaxID=2851599 RepID=A0A9E2W3V5_9BACT|nr:FkbM family methyltransferase [Pinibacter aurantiacus]MBV4358980.1 FkbM family methyltransferase [Pinibacter aurantiacus]
MAKIRLRKIVPDALVLAAKKGAYRLYNFTDKFFTGPFDVYDFQTTKVINKVLSRNSNFIDIGAHKGHILRELIKAAPDGKGFAFEPIPPLFEKIKKQYGKKVAMYNLALSDAKGEAEFSYVVDRPAISGLKERTVQGEDYHTKQIKVTIEMLDNIIPADIHIDLIKIDVEGAELGVLKGGIKTIKRCKPYILFEFGLGSADLYNTTPEMMYDLFEECGLSVSTLDHFLKGRAPFDRNEFIGQYNKAYNYFFIAYDVKRES